MKQKLLAIFILSTSLAISAADIPKGLFGTQGTESDAITDSTIDSIENSVNDIFDVNQKVFQEAQKNQSQNKSLFGWGPYGYVTTLGVTTAGKLGLVGLKGLAAVEVYWRKKAASNNKAVEENNDYSQAGAYEGFLTGDQDAEVEAQVQSALVAVKGSGRVQNLDKAEAGIRTYLKSFSKMASEIQNSPRNFGHWYLDAMRIDLSVAASGNVTPVISVGGGVLVRIFWHGVRAKATTPAPVVTEVPNNHLARFIADMALLADSLPVDKEIAKTGLGLKAIRIGVGVTAGGKIAIVGANGGLVFNIFLAHNPKYHSANGKEMAAPAAGEILVSHENNGETQITPVNMTKMRKGLIRAMKLSRPFLKKASKPNLKFEPFMMWNIFALNASGGVGLVTLGGTAQLQLIFKK